MFIRPLLAFLALVGAASTCTRARCAHAIAPVPSTHKLTATSPGVLRTFPVRNVQLRAARGEWESFQIVVRADNRPIKSLKLEATTLATQLGQFIGRENIQVFREHFTFVPKPSGNAELKPLWWSDALIPLSPTSPSTCEAKRAIAFWVAIRTPEKADKGEYYGAIDFDIDGEPRTLAVTFNVEDVALPAPTMRGTVAVYYDVLRDWYKKSGREFSVLEWAEQKKRYYDFLLGYRINAYDLPVAWDDPLASKYLSDPRVTSVRLPPLDSPEFPAAQSALEAARAKKKAFYYRIDEPTPDAYPQVLETTRKLRALDPQFKHLVTIHPNNALQDAVDIWCPNIGDATGVGWLDFARLEAERKKGRETWWYTMVEPKFPYPTWLLDDDALAVRSYGWLMARWGINGFVYSMAHGWGPEPLKNLQSYADTWGDGTLLYPGELVGAKGPIPSIRLMLLRDAIEDYELLKKVPQPEGLLLGIGPGPREQPVRGQAAGDAKPEAITEARSLLFAALSGQSLSPPQALTVFTNPFAPPAQAREVLIAPAPKIDGFIGNDAFWHHEVWSPKAKIKTDFNYTWNSSKYSDFFTQKRFVEDPLDWPESAFFLTCNSKYLYVALRGGRDRQASQVLEDAWYALEIAPADGREKWRFVVTSKDNLAVEKYTREGRFRVENIAWKAAHKKYSHYSDVEMAIPLSLLASRNWRINALRRVVVPSGAKVTLRAFDDAGDARAMPLFQVR